MTEIIKHIVFSLLIGALTAMLLIGLVLWSPKLAGADEQTDMVAKVIAAEACNQGEAGMIAVGNVIKNRVVAWHKTPYQIVTAKNQFYGFTAKNRDEIYQGCKKTADYVAANLMTLPDITHGGMYFLLPYEHTRAWHGDKTVTIREHTFYKERQSN